MLISIAATPASLVFLGAGFSKLRSPRQFEFTLINLGLQVLATSRFVRLLAVVELTAAALGVCATVIGTLALFPMARLLVAFTGILVWVRPTSCGCGSWEANWWISTTRNVGLMAILTLATIAP